MISLTLLHLNHLKKIKVFLNMLPIMKLLNSLMFTYLSILGHISAVLYYILSRGVAQAASQ